MGSRARASFTGFTVVIAGTTDSASSRQCSASCSAPQISRDGSRSVRHTLHDELSRFGGQTNVCLRLCGTIANIHDSMASAIVDVLQKSCTGWV